MKQQGLFESKDGTVLYYEREGEGRPLFLCQGLLCRREHWRYQRTHLLKKYQVITVDYRGHQRSSIPQNENHLTLEWCAQDVLDTLDHLKIEKCVFLGHSMGVPVITHLASSAPERIHAGVFICGAVNNPFQQMLLTNRLDQVFEVYAKVYEKIPHLMEGVWKKIPFKNNFSYWIASQLGFNPWRSDPEDVQGYLKGIEESTAKVFYSLLQNYRAEDRRDLLSSINVPILIVAGDEDLITPIGIQEETLARLKKGELEIIAGGSHNAHLDFPDLVNEKIESFLERVGYA